MARAPVSVVQIGIELNKTERDEGIQIASVDPKVQELLASGFAFEEDVHASHTCGMRITEFKAVVLTAVNAYRVTIWNGTVS